MRQVVLDTETTGLSAEGGDRLLEIGCVELVNRKLTGNNLHLYINPERDSHEDALRVRWSPPLQKLQPPSLGLGPSALKSTTPMDVSWCASLNASNSSATVCGRNALRTSGRLKAIRATPPLLR